MTKEQKSFWNPLVIFFSLVHLIHLWFTVLFQLSRTLITVLGFFLAVWDKKMVHTQFNWFWYHVPTFAPYNVEGIFFPLILAHSSTAQSAKTAAIVLQSLTPNAQSVFKILAEYQLSHPDEEGKWLRMIWSIMFHGWNLMCSIWFVIFRHASWCSVYNCSRALPCEQPGHIKLSFDRIQRSWVSKD